MAIALAACSNEDVMVGNQTPQAGFTLKAYVDNGGSRATAERDEEAQKHNFKWQTGDKIAVVANSNTIIMTLKDGDGGGTNSASFSADEEAAYVTTAIYPYNENEPSTYENNEWTVRLPKSYSYAGAYDGNINCPMLATVEGDDVDAQ